MPIARLKGVEDILNAANALHELLERRAGRLGVVIAVQ
jgi:hypothetical protein